LNGVFEKGSVKFPASWHRGAFGVWEPTVEKPSISPADLDFILVPGVVFGTQGQRIGRGAGFYDRYLEQLTHTIRVAFCFDCQLLDEVEQNPWDEPVDWIVTEKREIRLSSVNEKLRALIKI